eukprot:Skav200327  [mRNA]  locus=scaffold1760:283686:288213:+ [translate_table: standard]
MQGVASCARSAISIATAWWQWCAGDGKGVQAQRHAVTDAIHRNLKHLSSEGALPQRHGHEGVQRRTQVSTGR